MRNTLLCPDTGPDFVRCLKHSIFFSEKTYVFSGLNPGWVPTFKSAYSYHAFKEFKFQFYKEQLAKGKSKEDIIQELGSMKETDATLLESAESFRLNTLPTLPRHDFEDYEEFVTDFAPQLQTAVNKGFVIPLTDNFFVGPKNQIEFNKIMDETFERFTYSLNANRERLKRDREKQNRYSSAKQRRLRKSARERMETAIELLYTHQTACPASLDSIILSIIYIFEAKAPPDILDQIYELVDKQDTIDIDEAFCFLLYILICIQVLADKHAVLLTFDESFFAATQFVSNLFKVESEIDKTNSLVSARVTKVMIEERFPNMEKYSVEQVVKLRTRFQNELVVLWNAVDDLVRSDDNNDTIEKDVDRIINDSIRPALRQLKLQLEAVKNEGDFKVLTSTITPAFVFLSVSLFAGSDVNTSFIASGLGAVVGAAAQLVFGKRIQLNKILSQSKYGVLFKLGEHPDDLK